MAATPKKILIIEDEIAFVTLMSDRLTKDGYAVIKADDGKKGLNAAITQHPDLILLDIRMPVMDGLAVLSELRKDPWGKKAKVVMLTNIEPDKEIMKKVLECKPALYLIKSNVKLMDLVAKVKELT